MQFFIVLLNNNAQYLGEPVRARGGRPDVQLRPLQPPQLSHPRDVRIH